MKKILDQKWEEMETILDALPSKFIGYSYVYCIKNIIPCPSNRPAILMKWSLFYFSAKFDISIPEELKYVLVSDWDLLTHKKSLFSLPAKISVANILSDYTKNAEKLATGIYLY